MLSPFLQSIKQGFQAMNRGKIVLGLITFILGIAFLLVGQQVPRRIYEWFFLYLFLTALFSLLTRWFQPRDKSESLLKIFIRALFAVILGNAIWLQEATVYLMVIPIAIYQIFQAFTNLVTWYLYRNNKVTGRLSYLFDGIWMGAIGLYSLSPFHDAARFQFAILGLYLILLGFSQVRDGIYFAARTVTDQLKRQIRVPLPIFISAIIPAVALEKLNRVILENQGQAPDHLLHQVKADKTAEIELFVHTAPTNFFSKIGHVDIAYQGKVISFGSYDPDSERLMGMVGDGVLYECDRDAYIDLCKRESNKTLFAYGIDLDPSQEAAVIEEISKLKSLLVPWQPPQEPRINAEGQEEYTYAYKVQHQANGQLYKFTSSKFKSYFVLSTNCVLLADTIIGQAGTDIVSPKGFIAPGTYQSYLELEFEKPNGIVVTKSVY